MSKTCLDIRQREGVPLSQFKMGEGNILSLSKKRQVLFLVPLPLTHYKILRG